MINQSLLPDLLRRVKEAAGGDQYAILCAALDALVPKELSDPDTTRFRVRVANWIKASAFESAALGLCERVLPGWGVKLEHGMGDGTMATVGHVGPNRLYDCPEGWAEGATPALALVGAMLEALLSNTQDDGANAEGEGGQKEGERK